MKRALLTLVYLFITGMLISAQECPPGEAQIYLLTDQNQVAIYVSEGTISLKGINIETIFEGQPARFFLESYPDFDALHLDSLTGPHCLYLLAGDSPLVTPSQCANLGPDQETVQRISSDQNFWYDAGTDRWSNLSIMQFAYNLEVCSTPSAPCIITIPPLAVPVPYSALCSNPILCELFLDPSIIEGAQSFAFTENNGTLSDLLTPQCAYWGDYGLQIEFNMPPDPNGEQGGFGGWGVHWDFANNGSFNATKYEFLTFWLKTDIDANFQIGMKDTFEHETKIELQDWAQVDNWQLFRVPLSRFANDGVNLSSINNVSLGFNEEHGQANVCVDNIAFLQQAQTIDNGSTVNARIEPHTTCDVLNQIDSNELVYVAAENIPGTDVGGNSNWVLAIYQGQYVYLHSSLVIIQEGALPPTPTEAPTITPTFTESPTPTPIVDSGSILVADFESGTNINNLGQLMGSFYDPAKGDSIVETYQSGQVAVEYSLTANSFGGFWVQLGGTDFTPYTQLKFDIVASSPFNLKVELKRTNEVRSVNVDVTNTMQTISINLANLGFSTLTDMSELVFVLEQARAGNNGTLTIDNIIVGSADNFIVADFESGANINNLGQEMGAFYPEGTGDDIVVEYINGLVNVNYTLATNSYGGYWVKLGGADFSPYSQLAFDIMASASFSIKLELKHTGGGFAFQYIPVGPSRQTVTIDLEDLSLTDFSSMNELVFVLEQSRVGSNGIITIDNITLR